MAKGRQGKKTSSGTRNPDRPNGKAWKKNKNKPAKKRTPEREEKDFYIRMAREKRRQEGMARHAAEKEAERLRKEEEERLAAEAAAEAVAILKAQIEAELALKKRHDPLGVASRVKRKKVAAHK